MSHAHISLRERGWVFLAALPCSTRRPGRKPPKVTSKVTTTEQSTAPSNVAAPVVIAEGTQGDDDQVALAVILRLAGVGWSGTHASERNVQGYIHTQRHRFMPAELNRFISKDLDRCYEQASSYTICIAIFRSP